MVKKTPTPDNPSRCVAANGTDPGSVSGQYQVVVGLPKDPDKRAELLAFAVAAESLAELARKWASEEEPKDVEQSTQTVRLDVTIRMRPEGDSKS